MPLIKAPFNEKARQSIKYLIKLVGFDIYGVIVTLEL